jgi:uncharacterized protein (TIGR03000 family)
MYSVVLMAALTTNAGAPDLFLRGHGCCGCSGCYGCAGCSGCWGGCYGCAGGGWMGCYGSAGGGWMGCYGSAGGGWMGCYGSAGGGWMGCYGGCAGVLGSCYGGCYGACYGGPSVAPPPMEKPATPDKPDKEETVKAERARLIVEVPEGAAVFIDDRPTTSTAAVRTFRTPALAAGQTYYYEVRAEVLRDGRRVTETKKVRVRAGEEARADFTDMAGRVARAAP